MRLVQVDAYAFRKKVDAHATPCQLSQHTRAVTVGCPSNGRRASSISALHAPAAQTSAGGTACSLLPAAGSDSSDPRVISSYARKCLLITHKKMNTSPASWDSPWWGDALWAY